MDVFQGMLDELPPIEKYWTHMFQNKSLTVVSKCQSKVFQLSRLSNELLSTDNKTNKDTSSMIGDMVVTADKALLSGIWDEKKAMTEHI